MSDKDKDEFEDEFEDEEEFEDDDEDDDDFIDEDEFEDEEEVKAKPKKKSSKKSVKRKQPAKKIAAVSTERPQLDIVWVAVLVVIAFMVGYVIRGMFATTTQQTGVNQQTVPTEGMTAPPLTPEQMQTGEMPPGHPGGEGTEGGGTTETTQPSAEETTNP